MSMADVILIPIVLGLVMIPVYIGWTVIDEVNTAMNTEYPIVTPYFDDGKSSLRIFDYMMIFIVVSIGMGSIILAATIRTHPGATPIALLILATFVTVTAMMSNAWYEIQQAPQFATVANEMDNFVRINNQLPLVVAVLGALVIIALFAKPWERQQATSF
jgi:hypothetical protein